MLGIKLLKYFFSHSQPRRVFSIAKGVLDPRLPWADTFVVRLRQPVDLVHVLKTKLRFTRKDAALGRVRPNLL
jgi:3-methyladenine DNA glycosylase AlkC